MVIKFNLLINVLKIYLMLRIHNYSNTGIFYNSVVINHKLFD